MNANLRYILHSSASPNAIHLRVGSTRRDSGGRIVRVSNVTVHPRYGQPQFDNDIAALRLSQPLNFSPAIRPIRLPQRGQSVPLVRLTVTGWGLTAVSEYLKRHCSNVELFVLTNSAKSGDTRLRFYGVPLLPLTSCHTERRRGINERGKGTDGRSEFR